MRQKKNLIHTLKSYNLYTIFRFYIMREALKHKKYDPYVHPFSPNQTVNDRIKKAVTKQDVENAINETLKELDIHNTTTKNIIHWFNTLKHNSIKSHVFYSTII